MRRLLKVLDWLVLIAAAPCLIALLLQPSTPNLGLAGQILLLVVGLSCAYVAVRFGLPYTVGRGQSVDEVTSPIEEARPVRKVRRVTDPVPQAAKPVRKRTKPASRAVAEASCAGKIGWANFNGPLKLHVSVYRDRFFVWAMGRQHMISGSDITAIREDRFYRLRIEHTAPTTNSPICLDLSLDHPVCSAIERLARPPSSAGYQGIVWEDDYKPPPWDE